jgi:RimJ/RimL family protein N-acetyltransferase
MESSRPVHVTLRDGHHMTVRPIEPGDRARHAEFTTRLSAASRYRRFLGPQKRLTEAQTRFFTELDHHAHEALVAIDDDDEIIGVARFVRAGPASPDAEVAIVVSDEWQGRGVGSALMDLLAERARKVGVERFEAYCFSDNAQVLDLLDRVGPAAHHPSDANLVDLEIDVAAGPHDSLLEGIEIDRGR